MKKQLKVLTAVLCSAAISLNTMSYLNAEISQDKITYLGLPIKDTTADYFPDAVFQKYLEEKVDKDGNKYLSDQEIANVTEINLTSDYKNIEMLMVLKFLQT